MEKIDTIPKTNKENEEYVRQLEIAIGHIEEAIAYTSYRSDLIDEYTGKRLNQDLIDNLNDIIYELEDAKEVPVMKPYKDKKLKEC